MTPEQCKHHLENGNFQAFIEGRLEFECDRRDVWVTLKSSEFNLPVTRYRIRPEAKYIPFTAETFKPFRHRWWRRKNSSEIWQTTFYDEKSHHCTTWEMSLEIKEFDDGTPFGLKVSE